MMAGIWRDELIQKIKPYIHPACLGVKVKTMKELNLRFNLIPQLPVRDPFMVISSIILEKYGTDSVFVLKRSNKLQYHEVFNGIYGGLIYHHHFGTRFKDGAENKLQSFGWQERNETMSNNKMMMECTTEMLFHDHTDFMNELAYGAKYRDLKLYYYYYLSAGYSKVRIYRLFILAKRIYPDDAITSFYILTLINKELSDNKKYLEFYIQICREMGYEMEAEAYQDLLINQVLDR